MDTKTANKLMRAVDNNQLRYLARKLLMKRRLVQQTLVGSDNLLTYSIKGRKLEVVKLLLFYGADVNYMCSFHRSPLHLAVDEELYDPKIAKQLLKHGPDMSLRDNNGNTVLHEVARYLFGDDLLKLLLSQCKQTDLNATNNNGETPCLVAAKARNVTKVILFLEHTMATGEVNMESILHKAIDTKQLPIIEIVAAYSALHPLNKHNQTPFLYALYKNIKDKPILEFLLQLTTNINCHDTHGNTPLHFASYNNNADIALLLIKNGADVTYRNTMGMCPMHIAAFEGHEDVMTNLCFSNGMQTTGLRMKDRHGRTPLRIACINHRKEIIKIILRAYIVKSNIRKKRDVISNLPGILTILFGPHNKHLANLNTGMVLQNSIFKALENAADINEIDAFGKTLLLKAVETRQCELVEMLVNSDANIDIQDCSGNTCLHVAAEQRSFQIFFLLLKHAVRIQTQNSLGQLPLHVAFEYRFHQGVSELLKYHRSNSKIVVDVDGNTVLHTAIENYDFSDSAFDNLQELLWLYPTIKSIQNFAKETPLITATKSGRTEIVSLLLTHNVDVTRCDQVGLNAIDYALLNKQKDIIVALISSNLVDVNNVNENGDSILHLAVRAKNEMVINLLLQSEDIQLEINKQNSDGDTALHLSFNDHVNLSAAEILLEKGASPYVKNKNNKSTLTLASKRREITLTSLFFFLLDDTVTDSLASDFGCPICYEIPKTIFKCENGHDFCAECATKLELCPMCRVSLLFNCLRNTTKEAELSDAIFEKLVK